MDGVELRDKSKTCFIFFCLDRREDKSHGMIQLWIDVHVWRLSTSQSVKMILEVLHRLRASASYLRHYLPRRTPSTYAPTTIASTSSAVYTRILSRAYHEALRHRCALAGRTVNRKCASAVFPFSTSNRPCS